MKMFRVDWVKNGFDVIEANNEEEAQKIMENSQDYDIMTITSIKECALVEPQEPLPFIRSEQLVDPSKPSTWWK